MLYRQAGGDVCGVWRVVCYGKYGGGVMGDVVMGCVVVRL